MLSTATSFFLAGIKIAKLEVLKDLWHQRAALQRKLVRTDAEQFTADMSSWLHSMPRLVPYAGTIERGRTTAECMLGVSSDDALIELGIESELDRKYLLLQLARLRGHGASCVWQCRMHAVA